MWPKTAKFENEAQRMDSWQTSLVVKKKIFKPSKRLVICKQGVDALFEEQNKYEEFLRNFRTKSKDKPSAYLRGSYAGSSIASGGGS